jgi:hypothetical protein
MEMVLEEKEKIYRRRRQRIETGRTAETHMRTGERSRTPFESLIGDVL